MANTNSPRRSWVKKKAPQFNPKLVSSAVQFSYKPKHGYFGFQLYFPEHGSSVETLLKCVIHCENFIKRNLELFSLVQIQHQKQLILDYKFLISEEICTEWSDFKTEIVNNTEFCLNCMGLAIHQTIAKDLVSHEEKGQKFLDVIRVRLINYEPIQHIKDIGVDNYGKLIALRGTVIKAANVKLAHQFLAFSCMSCTGVQVIRQPDNIFTPPTKCETVNCRANSRNFKPMCESQYSKIISFQKIKIQEVIGTDQFENGRIPRTLECELTEDLVNSCVPGDDVTITGIIKINSSETSFKTKQNAMFELQLFVISVLKNQSEGNCEQISFNTTDYYAIDKIHSQPNLFRFLVQSLCPNIYGQELVKAGLLLSLFGGTKTNHKRSVPHILMVGDPGLGKSQLLNACTNLAPRGVYVCGNTSTGSGLTVTMTREGGEYTLEAGALMLADQGCCCIDEFDKMPTQHACLLEAMEQQSISIAKAGIVCSLHTRATILAAANPAGGHYNKAKTIAENLKIASPMLSRFDLIFILLDESNQVLDMMVSDHVLAMHSGRNYSSFINTTGSNVRNKSLKGRLSLQVGEEIDYLPHLLFRKYIAYAQKYVNPQLSEEAKCLLKDAFLKLRKQYQNGHSTPITVRQLNSLIRLTQARAKIELREEATKEDAADVIEIMKEALINIFTDDVGSLDTTRTQSGTGMSAKNKLMKLLSLLQEQSKVKASAIFTKNEIKDLSEEVGIEAKKFFSIFENLNIHGYILKKGGNNYQLVTADL